MTERDRVTAEIAGRIVAGVITATSMYIERDTLRSIVSLSEQLVDLVIQRGIDRRRSIPDPSVPPPTGRSDW